MFFNDEFNSYVVEVKNLSYNNFFEILVEWKSTISRKYILKIFYAFPTFLTLFYVYLTRKMTSSEIILILLTFNNSKLKRYFIKIIIYDIYLQLNTFQVEETYGPDKWLNEFKYTGNMLRYFSI